MNETDVQIEEKLSRNFFFFLSFVLYLFICSCSTSKVSPFMIVCVFHLFIFSRKCVCMKILLDRHTQSERNTENKSFSSSRCSFNETID